MKIALAAALAAGVVASAPVALADDSAPDLRIGQAGTLVNGEPLDALEGKARGRRGR